MYFLSEELWFPPVEMASPEGVLAIGGDLSIARLQLAYRQGIFPWFTDGDPIIWYAPDPRMVLFPERLRVSKSMRKVLANDEFTVTYNQAFDRVIENCKTIQRRGQNGTWITEAMKLAYLELHKVGWAKSVEVWQKNELVGGLYGIDLKTIFCGESMFSKRSNASKIAFVHLVEKLKKEDYKLIDCQVYNSHLASLGAQEIPRKEFLKYL